MTTPQSCRWGCRRRGAGRGRCLAAAREEDQLQYSMRPCDGDLTAFIPTSLTTPKQPQMSLSCGR